MTSLPAKSEKERAEALAAVVSRLSTPSLFELIAAALTEAEDREDGLDLMDDEVEGSTTSVVKVEGSTTEWVVRRYDDAPEPEDGPTISAAFGVMDPFSSILGPEGSVEATFAPVHVLKDAP